MNKKTILIVFVGLIAFLLLKKETVISQQSASEESAKNGEVLPATLKSVDSQIAQAIKPIVNLESKNPDRKKQLSPEEIERVRHKIKSFLSAAYSSQTAFKAEYDQYVSDIMATGLSMDPVLPFKAGFLEPSEAPQGISSESNIDVRRMNTDSLIGERDQVTNETYQYAPIVSDIDLSAYKEFCKYGCTADKDHFEMLIAVPLGSTNRVDVWIINHRKEIIQVKDGSQ